jgi:hypothetical protein
VTGAATATTNDRSYRTYRSYKRQGGLSPGRLPRARQPCLRGAVFAAGEHRRRTPEAHGTATTAGPTTDHHRSAQITAEDEGDGRRQGHAAARPRRRTIGRIGPIGRIDGHGERLRREQGRRSMARRIRGAARRRRTTNGRSYRTCRTYRRRRAHGGRHGDGNDGAAQNDAAASRRTPISRPGRHGATRRHDHDDER